MSTYYSPVLVLRVPTGIPLSNQQVDDNFSNLLSGIDTVNSDAIALSALKANITDPTFLGLVRGPTALNSATGTVLTTIDFLDTRLGALNDALLPATTATTSTVAGVTTYSGIDIGSPTKRFANLYVKAGRFAANTITLGDVDISANDDGGIVLPANTSVGADDNIIPTNLADKIELISLSATTATAAGAGGLAYNNTTGVFTFTPGNLADFATEVYVNTAISNLVDSAPGSLDTLNELAAALGDDSNFAGSVTTSLAAKASITYVDNEIASLSTLHSPIFTGIPTAPTAAPATNTTQLATTAFVLANGGGLNIDGGTATTTRNTSTIALNGGGA